MFRVYVTVLVLASCNFTIGTMSAEGQPTSRATNLENPIGDLVRAHDWSAALLRLLRGPELVGGEGPFRTQVAAFEEAVVLLLLSREVPPGRDLSVQAYHRSVFTLIRGISAREPRTEPWVVRPFRESRELLLRVSDRLLEAGEVQSSTDAFVTVWETVMRVEEQRTEMVQAVESRVRQPNERSAEVLRLMTRAVEWQAWEPVLRRLWADRAALPHVEEALRRLAGQQGWD